MIQISKIENDKYYTPISLANACIDKVLEIIGRENISEVVEPSVGNGAFLHNPNLYVHFGYDIQPECDAGTHIIKGDYLTQDITYLYGRLVIGNPPFGYRNNLAIKFYKKAISECDYISFILPVSQYNNNQKMFEFDLIYSEDLGFKNYSGINLNCAFNIYKRNENGIRNKPINYTLNDVKVIEYRRGSKDELPTSYDFAMCTWGDGSCGKKIDYSGQYAQEHYIIVSNPIYKNKIIELCENTDWRHLYPSVSSAKLQTWKIYKYIKEQIPEIK